MTIETQKETQTKILTDIEIAQKTPLLKVKDIAESLGFSEDDIEPYGYYKAKITQNGIDKVASKPFGKLVLVTAINPTPAGEGKTTTSIGLADALRQVGKNAVVALREPSLGPVFGIKGGACGGGYAQVVPMEDINLHFTGDMHAITAANNLLCALLDNHISKGNVLKIDTRRVVIKRCLDINDRELRNCIVGLGGTLHGVPREDHFCITVATEIMAILCLASDLSDLTRRLSQIIVAYNTEGEPVFANDLKAVGAMTVLLKDAINPNLVQTLEHTPAFIHGGPFANIAHGCNSVRATKLAMKLSDITVTEAGFGSDLGAEKFFDIKCRTAGISPSCVVIVATVRSLKYNGGVNKNELKTENLDALKCGIVNLGAHIENMQKFGVPVVVAINHFYTDTAAETDFVRHYCEEKGVTVAFSDVFLEGGKGGIDLANAVIKAVESDAGVFKPLYDVTLTIKEKLNILATEIYRANGVTYTAAAEKAIKAIVQNGFSNLPVCVAKTQYSLSDDPTKLGLPTDFSINVRDVTVSSGAGFIVAVTGEIMTMPGLPATPAAENIAVDDSGKIVGLF